jgi:predicted RNA-binding protein with PUA-like domain
MNYFLAKTDPETYSIEQFVEEKKTTWDGVTNAQAVGVIRRMKPGDKVFLYHSNGGAKQPSGVVGMAVVRSEPKPDPKNAKSAVVDLEFLFRLEPATTLKDVKESGMFEQWALVRQSRLSTMEAPETFVEWMRGRYPGVKI